MKLGKILESDSLVLGSMIKCMLTMGSIGLNDEKLKLQCPECDAIFEKVVDTRKRNFVKCSCCGVNFRFK